MEREIEEEMRRKRARSPQALGLMDWPVAIRQVRGGDVGQIRDALSKRCQGV